MRKKGNFLVKLNDIHLKTKNKKEKRRKSWGEDILTVQGTTRCGVSQAVVKSL